MEAPPPAAGGNGGAAGDRKPAGSDPAAAGPTLMASRSGTAAESVEVTYRYSIPVPAAAKPWFPRNNDEEKVQVTVYGRLPCGTIKPHSVTLHRKGWHWLLTGIVLLVRDLGVHKGDRVRLTREVVAVEAAGGGTGAGGDQGVVVEKVAGQQQQQQKPEQHRRRHVRTLVHLDLPLEPAGPAASPVVVSESRRFVNGSAIVLTQNIVPCLLDESHVKELTAAAASTSGSIPKYNVTVYARRAGEDGPPVPFEGATLTPSPSLQYTGSFIWQLNGLGALRVHLGLVPGFRVLVVREVGQDCRVRLVLQPWKEGGGGAVREGEEGDGDGEGTGNGSAGVEEEERDTGKEQLLGGDASEAGEGVEAGGSDDERRSSSVEGSGSGSDDPNWVPGGGTRQSSGGARRAQPQPPQPPLQPLPPPPHRQQTEQTAQRLQPPPPLQLSDPTMQPQHLQSPLPQRPEQQSKPGPADPDGSGGGGAVAGPSGTAGVGGGGAGGVGLGRAREGPDTAEEGRLGKRRRLQVSAVLPEERPAVGQHGSAAEGGGVAECGGERGGNDLLHSGANLLLTALEASRTALAAAQARAAALAADKAALEGQLGREREAREAAKALLGKEREAAQQQLQRERARAEAAEEQLRCARQHMAGVLRRAGVADGGGPAAVQQLQLQAPQTPRTVG